MADLSIAKHMNIMPDLIIGDMDSISSEILNHYL